MISLLKLIVLLSLYVLLIAIFAVGLLAICINFGDVYTFGLAKAEETAVFAVTCAKPLSDLLLWIMKPEEAYGYSD